MPSKEKLLAKLYQQRIPKNFTIKELNQLMSKCHCVNSSGGRGSAVKYYHPDTGRVLQFDLPHPGNNLYAYQIKMLKSFLKSIGEFKED